MTRESLINRTKSKIGEAITEAQMMYGHSLCLLYAEIDRMLDEHDLTFYRSTLNVISIIQSEVENYLELKLESMVGDNDFDIHVMDDKYRENRIEVSSELLKFCMYDSNEY